MSNKREYYGRLLIVDDNRSVLSALHLLLSGIFDTVDAITQPDRIHEMMEKNRYDAILLDMNFRAGINSGNEGFYWLGEILNRDSSASVVMITAYGDVELAVNAIQMGAVDFILKPWENNKLIATVTNAAKLHRSRLEITKLKKEKKSLNKVITNTGREKLIGNSPPVKAMMGLIEKVSGTDANILLTGENGTGKEVVARTIHEMSLRANEILVTVDMGSIVESLFESELFGHRKGAFTDAGEDRTGKIELASGGTLFLDEIGNLPLNLQAKLLSVLQTRNVTPVGSNKQVEIDIRLICATNRDLDHMVRDGSFREDLLYRLNTICIRVPSLCERRSDIPLLAGHFLAKYSDKYLKNGTEITPEAMSELVTYSWPGNVRELQHTIEKAVILCEGKKIRPNDLMLKKVPNTFSASEEMLSIDEMEKRLIASVLNKHNGNLSSAAKQLGITRQTLYNKIRRHGL